MHRIFSNYTLRIISKQIQTIPVFYLIVQFVIFIAVLMSRFVKFLLNGSHGPLKNETHCIISNLEFCLKDCSCIKYVEFYHTLHVHLILLRMMLLLLVLYYNLRDILGLNKWNYQGSNLEKGLYNAIFYRVLLWEKLQIIIMNF